MKKFFTASLTMALILTFNCFAQAETVKIGAIFALSGKARASNNPAVQGVKHAIERIAKMQEEGATDRNIEVVIFDNESTPIGSHMAAMKAIEQNVAIIVGSSWSSHSLPIARVAQKNGTPMISPVSTVPSLTRIGDCIFRICYNNDFQGKAIANFSHQELRSKTALVFTDIASDFSLNISRTFKETFTGLGGEIAGVIEYKNELEDLKDTFDNLKGLHADIAFLSGHDESGFIAKRLLEEGITAIPVGTDGWASESFYSNGGNTIPEGYFIDHWVPEITPPEWQVFLASIMRTTNVMAPTALAFDATMLAAKAILESPTTSRADLRDTIHQTNDYIGITGEIHFDNIGDAFKAACITKIKDGSPSHLKCVAP